MLTDKIETLSLGLQIYKARLLLTSDIVIFLISEILKCVFKSITLNVLKCSNGKKKLFFLAYPK